MQEYRKATCFKKHKQLAGKGSHFIHLANAREQSRNQEIMQCPIYVRPCVYHWLREMQETIIQQRYRVRR